MHLRCRRHLGAFLFASVIACGASWNDTFRGQDTRTTLDAGAPDDTGAAQACVGLAMAHAPVASIVVTFPMHGKPGEKIHVAVGSSSCDLTVDTDTDNVVFVSDASPCASLLAPPTPSASTATASAGSGGPNDMLFQWSYASQCTVADDYTLSKQ